MITNAQIREKLIEAIKNSGVTQSEIASSVGVTHQQISGYVCGIKMPSLDTFANICKVLDLDANEILCLTNN